MAFQFNFSIDTTEAVGNGRLQQEMGQLGKQEDPSEKKEENSVEGNTVNKEPFSGITINVADRSEAVALPKKHFPLKSVKEHDVPKDISKLLENKIVRTLPGKCHVNLHLVAVAPCEDAPGEDAASEGSPSQSDLITGVYEGGFKIWECTFDLIDYLSESDIQFAHKSVLDLGCGAGLLGIVALKGNAEEIHFQDYNSSVIEEITLPNVLVNCVHQDAADGEMAEMALKQCSKGEFAQDLFSKCRFFSGEWSEFNKLLLNSKNSLAKYDVILTSETIYNPDYYEALHDTLSNLLGINGCVYLASKAYYFGCGGGVLLFTKFIEEKNVFKCRTVKVLEKGLQRFIIELVFKNSTANMPSI